ncbi:MAG: type IV pilus modification protein PilV [Gammaproteobacteria bacterium]|nr:type IV pilus modification protein PilV [Gammaproteobacteria bacterium]
MTEVLVTVVILSIGLLGIAGLQATALRNNHSAYLRTQATLLSYDIADRMRANMSAVNGGSYNTPAAASVASCSTVAGCSSDQMAQNDAWQWRQEVASLLPKGVGIVCLDSSPDDGTGVAAPACSGGGSIYVIKIWWDDDRSGNLKRFVMSFQP